MILELVYISCAFSLSIVTACGIPLFCPQIAQSLNWHTGKPELDIFEVGVLSLLSGVFWPIAWTVFPLGLLAAWLLSKVAAWSDDWARENK